MSAWAQANIMTMLASKGHKVRADQLFKRRDAPPEFATSAEFTQYMRERAEAAEDDS